MTKLIYRKINPNKYPLFTVEEEILPTRGAAEHRAEILEMQGGVQIIKTEEIE